MSVHFPFWIIQLIQTRQLRCSSLILQELAVKTPVCGHFLHSVQLWCISHVCSGTLGQKAKADLFQPRVCWVMTIYPHSHWHWCLSGCRVKAERSAVIYWVGLLQREAGRIKCSHLESEAHCGHRCKKSQRGLNDSIFMNGLMNSRRNRVRRAKLILNIYQCWIYEWTRASVQEADALATRLK